jgi:hypothetical protein
VSDASGSSSGDDDSSDQSGARGRISFSSGSSASSSREERAIERHHSPSRTARGRCGGIDTDGKGLCMRGGSGSKRRALGDASNRMGVPRSQNTVAALKELRAVRRLERAAASSHAPPRRPAARQAVGDGSGSEGEWKGPLVCILEQQVRRLCQVKARSLTCFCSFESPYRPPLKESPVLVCSSRAPPPDTCRALTFRSPLPGAPAGV